MKLKLLFAFLLSCSSLIICAQTVEESPVGLLNIYAASSLRELHAEINTDPNVTKVWVFSGGTKIGSLDPVEPGVFKIDLGSGKRFIKKELSFYFYNGPCEAVDGSKISVKLYETIPAQLQHITKEHNPNMSDEKIAGPWHVKVWKKSWPCEFGNVHCEDERISISVY